MKEDLLRDSCLVSEGSESVLEVLLSLLLLMHHDGVWDNIESI